MSGHVATAGVAWISATRRRLEACMLNAASHNACVARETSASWLVLHYRLLLALHQTHTLTSPLPSATARTRLLISKGLPSYTANSSRDPAPSAEDNPSIS